MTSKRAGCCSSELPPAEIAVKVFLFGSLYLRDAWEKEEVTIFLKKHTFFYAF